MAAKTGGERLAELQQLLKTEEAETLSQRKTLVAVEQQCQRTSDELVDAFWELCYCDAQIASFSAAVAPSSLSASEQQQQQRRRSHLVQNLSVEVRRSVEEFFKLLKLRPDCVVRLLAEAGLLGSAKPGSVAAAAAAAEVCHAVVFSLFGSCFAPADERRLLALLLAVWRAELSMEEKAAAPFAERLLATFLRTTYANPFLVPTVRDAVVAAINLALEGKPAAAAAPVRKQQSFSPLRRQLVAKQRHSTRLSEQQMARPDFPAARRHATEAHPQLPSASTVSAAAEATLSPQRTRALWPKRGADSSEEQLAAIVTTPWLITVGYLARHVVAMVSESLASLPYGLRWVCKSLASESLKPARELVVDIVFRKFVAAAVARPQDWALGVYPPREALSTLAEMAQIVVDAVSSTAAANPVLESFFESVPDVETPEEFFGEAESMDETPQALVSTYDLGALLKLAAGLQMERLASAGEDESDRRQVLSRLHELAQFILGKLPHLRTRTVMFMRIKDLSVQPPESSQESKAAAKHSNAVHPEPQIEACKKNLALLLVVLERLCGCHGQKLVPALALQRVRNRFFQANVISSRIQLAVELLEALPAEWKRDDFSKLLDEMFADVQARKEERTRQLQEPMVRLNKVQLHCSQVSSQKDAAMEHLNLLLFQRFLISEFTGVDDFASLCRTRFGSPATPCNCKPRVFDDGSNTCSTCTEKAAFFGEFVRYFKEQLSKHAFSEEFQRLSVHNLEALVLSRVYPTMFPCLLADMEFYAQSINVADSIPLRALLIPERFHSQAPWPLAQKELRKIALFRAPYEKFLCIKDTWKVLFSYMRPVSSEDLSPDDFLPIFAFVILQALPPDFLSNLQYITLYASLDTSESVWLMHAKSSVEICQQVFSGKLPMWKTCNPTQRTLRVKKKKALIGRHVANLSIIGPIPTSLRKFSHRSMLQISYDSSSETASAAGEDGDTSSGLLSVSVDIHDPAGRRKRSVSVPPPLLHGDSQPPSSVPSARPRSAAFSAAQPIEMKPPSPGEIDPLGALLMSSPPPVV